jgi:hypothetical protein
MKMEHHDGRKVTKLLTTNEAAQLLRRSPVTLRKWAMASGKEGPIQPVRTMRGAKLLWRLSDIEELIGQ